MSIVTAAGAACSMHNFKTYIHKVCYDYKHIIMERMLSPSPGKGRYHHIGEGEY